MSPVSCLCCRQGKRNSFIGKLLATKPLYIWSKILFRNGGSPTLNCSSVLNIRTSPFLSGLPCLEVATLRLCSSVGYESPYGSPGELAAPVQPCHTADRVPSSGLRLAFLLGLQFRLIINVRSFDNHP